MTDKLSLESKHLCGVDYLLFTIPEMGIVDVSWTMRAHPFIVRTLRYSVILKPSMNLKMMVTNDFTIKQFYFFT